jgi:hypothetical protein
METDLDEMYNRKAELLDLFNPDNALSIRWTLPYGVRQFDGFYYDDLSLGWDKRKWAAQNFGVVIKCPDPTAYDPSRKTKTFVGSASGAAFTIPWYIPLYIGGSNLDDVQVIAYPGTWISYPEVEIVGPATDAVITNLETGEKLDFSGLTLGSTERIVVDTRYGFKTVVDQDGVNAIDALTDDSDLSTFHIEHKRPGESARDNPIWVIASGIDSGTRVVLRYYERYTGK